MVREKAMIPGEAEKIINNFLHIFENQSEIIYSSETEKLLTDLGIVDDIAKSPDKSNEEVAQAILDCCQSYPDIYNAVLGVRKPSPRPVDSSKQELMLKNLWPDLPENLRKRTDNPQTPSQQNDS